MKCAKSSKVSNLKVLKSLQVLKFLNVRRLLQSFFSHARKGLCVKALQHSHPLGLEEVNQKETRSQLTDSCCRRFRLAGTSNDGSPKDTGTFQTTFRQNRTLTEPNPQGGLGGSRDLRLNGVFTPLTNNMLKLQLRSLSH